MSRMLLLLLLISCPLFAESGFSLRILSSKGDEVLTQPYFTPRLVFKVLSGKPDRLAYNCQEERRERKWADHSEIVIVVKCDDGVELELRGVTLQ